ncbi:MAG: FAD-dependent oxidoreductase [Bacteroidota bacterium]
MNISFWEQRHLFEQVDFCITGGGIVGLHTALFLRDKYPTAKILVLEKALIGAAASSKNAGFACFGSVSEILDDIATIGTDAAFELIRMRWDGLQLLQKTHGKQALGLQVNGGWELFTAADRETFEQCMQLIPELNRGLDYIGPETYNINQKDTYQFNGITNTIFNRYEGQVNTDLMYYNLELKALKSGIRMIRGIQVTGFSDNASGVSVALGDFSFNCRKLLITNNGFAATLLASANVEPARAQVLVTEPIPGFTLNGTYHYDKGYYYFRNCGDRLLIGGGRNTDFDAENTSEQQITDNIQQKIEELMYAVILKEKVKIEYRWAGTMGIGKTKFPIIEEISPNVSCGVRMGGMGVAIGALVAEKLVSFN